MIKSMTGFGSAEGEVGGARVSVEIRSVNHRFFNPSIKLPSELSKWEGDVREALRKGVARGHVTLFARVERPESDGGRIDEERFARVRRADSPAAGALRSRSTTLDVGTVLRMPDVIASTDERRRGHRRPSWSRSSSAQLRRWTRCGRGEGARLATYLDGAIGESSSRR